MGGRVPKACAITDEDTATKSTPTGGAGENGKHWFQARLLRDIAEVRLEIIAVRVERDEAIVRAGAGFAGAGADSERVNIVDATWTGGHV